MVPPAAVLTIPVTGGPIAASGRPIGQLRDELRRIPSYRNALSVVGWAAQTALVIATTVTVREWWARLTVWPIAFVLMGRSHAQLAALMHEAAHRLLFRNKQANDLVGRWLLGYVGFTNTDAYRRVHMAHHRDEFGPDEPDIALYAGYPVGRASLRRKLIRDATGRTGLRLLRQQLNNFRSPDQRSRKTVTKIYAVQVGLAAISWIAGYPLVYWLLWFLPYLTVWRVINRLRSVAEHGGMKRSADRRETTHAVRQHWLARFLLVPYWIGWHLPHHCDSGVPMRNLPRFQKELQAAGYLTDDLEYRSYRALWRALQR